MNSFSTRVECETYIHGKQLGGLIGGKVVKFHEVDDRASAITVDLAMSGCDRIDTRTLPGSTPVELCTRN